jgi:hypothetical protein
VRLIRELHALAVAGHAEINEGWLRMFEDVREAQRCCRSVPTVPRSARSLLDP